MPNYNRTLHYKNELLCFIIYLNYNNFAFFIWMMSMSLLLSPIKLQKLVFNRLRIPYFASLVWAAIPKILYESC